MRHMYNKPQGDSGVPNDFHNPFKDFFRYNVSTFFQNCSIGFSFSRVLPSLVLVVFKIWALLVLVLNNIYRIQKLIIPQMLGKQTPTKSASTAKEKKAGVT